MWGWGGVHEIHCAILPLCICASVHIATTRESGSHCCLLPGLPCLARQRSEADLAQFFPAISFPRQFEESLGESLARTRCKLRMERVAERVSTRSSERSYLLSTHKHHSGVAVATKMINVEDSDFSTVTARDTFDVSNPCLRFLISLGITSVNVF